jgi:hypothetical protein
MTRIANISSIDWTHQARRQQTRSEGDHLRKVEYRLFFVVSTDEGKFSAFLGRFQYRWICLLQTPEWRASSYSAPGCSSGKSNQ